MPRKVKIPCTCAAVKVKGAVFNWLPCREHRRDRHRATVDQFCACLAHTVGDTDHLDAAGWWHTADRCFRGPA